MSDLEPSLFHLNNIKCESEVQSLRYPTPLGKGDHAINSFTFSGRQENFHVNLHWNAKERDAEKMKARTNLLHWVNSEGDADL